MILSIALLMCSRLFSTMKKKKKDPRSYLLFWHKDNRQYISTSVHRDHWICHSVDPNKELSLLSVKCKYNNRSKCLYNLDLLTLTYFLNILPTDVYRSLSVSLVRSWEGLELVFFSLDLCSTEGSNSGCRRACLLRWSLLINLLSQYGQQNRFSPVEFETEDLIRWYRNMNCCLVKSTRSTSWESICISKHLHFHYIKKEVSKL